MKKLFLDDYRAPIDCFTYMYKHIGNANHIYLDKDWFIVKNYLEFCKWISTNGLPDIISFDHDLADEHYLYDEMDAPCEQYEEKTGADALKFLLQICKQNNFKLPIIYIHTMNPVGRENMNNILNKYKENG